MPFLECLPVIECTIPHMNDSVFRQIEYLADLFGNIFHCSLDFCSYIVCISFHASVQDHVKCLSDIINIKIAPDMAPITMNWQVLPLTC